MLPVLQIAERRAHFRAVPPGFKTSPFFDGNNNAGKVRTLTGRIIPMKQLTSSNFIGLLKVPANAVRQLNFCHHGSTTSSSRDSLTHAKPQFYMDTVGKETVPINTAVEPDPEEDPIEKDDRQTPENFGETFEYFLSINSKREEMLKVIFSLGDQLLEGQIEGDREGWKLFTDLLATEIKAWKKRCETSDTYFNQTRKILKTEEPSMGFRCKKFLYKKKVAVRDCVEDVCACLYS